MVHSSYRHVEYLLVVSLCCLLFACTSHRTTKQSPSTNTVDRFQSRMDSILDDSAFAHSFIGFKVVALKDGKTLYSRNGDKLFHPASNMKLLTTAAAILHLDRNFKFVTKVLADRKIDRGTLRGNLYIKGSGDPKMSTSDLDSLAKAIQSFGITTIAGNLVGDITYFDTLSWGQGWMLDDETEAYEAAITPLTVNDNAIRVTVSPGKEIGEFLRFSVEPMTKVITLVNLGITSPDSSIPTLTVTRRRGENTVVIRGRMNPNEEEQHIDLSVWKPEVFFLELLREKLLDHGIRVQGKCIIDSVRGRIRVAEVSHTIDSVLRRINKQSDNLAAENLLKTLAAESRGTPGSAVAGLSIVKSSLSMMEIDTTAIVLADGSGLSFYNSVSPDILVRVLEEEYRDKSNFERFYESLPVAGIDGTLKARMRHTRAEANVHAKTGSLTGVSALSGYVTSADGQLLAFSMIGNHFPGSMASLRAAQDRIMELLADTYLH